MSEITKKQWVGSYSSSQQMALDLNGWEAMHEEVFNEEKPEQIPENPLTPLACTRMQCESPIMVW